MIQAPPPNLSSRAVPKPIIRKLQALVRRTQRILFFRGIFGMVALGLGTLLGMVAVDYLLTLATSAARVTVMLGGLVVVAIAAVRLTLASRSHRLSLVTAARLVEIQHPEIQERLSSTVELHGDGEADVAIDLGAPQVSASLVAALTEEAELEATRINPRREISAKPVRPYLLAALLLAMLWVMVFHFWPTHASLALARMFSPNANLDNLPAIDLTVTPGDRFVAIGDELVIRATGPEGTPTDAVIEIIDSTGFASQRAGQPDAGIQDRLSASWQFPAVMASFRYRIRAGRALTRYYEIMAVTRPRAEAFEVRLELPEYTTRPAKTVAELPQVIEAVAGTQVTVRVTTNVPAAHSRLLATSSEPGDKASGGSSPGSLQPVADPTSFRTDDGQPGCSWTFALEPGLAGPAAIVLEDEHGVTSTPIPFELKVIPDRPPTISIVAPTVPTMKAKPTDRVTLKYLARDDFGLARIGMLLKLDEAPQPEVPLPLPEDAAKPVLACQGDAVLDLKQLDLSMTHRVIVQMQAADTLPQPRKGPQRGVSKPLVIEIEHPADKSPEAVKAAMEKRLEEERKEVQKLEELAQRQEELAKQAEQPPESKDQQEEPKPDPAKEAAWKQAEQAVARETAQMMKKQPEALRAELKADQQQAKEMAREAKQLAQEQQQLRRETLEAATKPDSEKLKKRILEQLAQKQKTLAQEAAQQEKRNQETRELAKQEKNVAEALDAVKEGDLKKALAKMEQGVKEKAQELHQQAQEMSERAENLALNPSSQNEAREAAAKLNEAQQNADQAQQQLPRNPAAAAQSELRTAQALERSAELLSQLSRDLGRQADAIKAKEPERAEEGRNLATALQEATEAAQSQDSQQRAEAARAAAQALSQAAQEASALLAAHDPARAQAHPDAKLAKGPTPDSKATGQPTPPVTPAAGTKVKALQTETPDTDWVKFQGKVKSEAQNEADQDMSDEYRELVRRYFEELAKQGGVKKGK